MTDVHGTGNAVVLVIALRSRMGIRSETDTEVPVAH